MAPLDHRANRDPMGRARRTHVSICRGFHCAFHSMVEREPFRDRHLDGENDAVPELGGGLDKGEKLGLALCSERRRRDARAHADAGRVVGGYGGERVKRGAVACHCPCILLLPATSGLPPMVSTRRGEMESTHDWASSALNASSADGCSVVLACAASTSARDCRALPDEPIDTVALAHGSGCLVRRRVRAPALH